MKLNKAISIINQNTPKNYEKPSYIYLDIIDDKNVEFKGRYLKKVNMEDKDEKDKALKEIKKLEGASHFKEVFEDEELVKNINNINKNNDFKIQKNIDIINQEQKMHIYTKDKKLIEKRIYTIDITNNDTVEKIKNKIKEKDPHINTLDDLKSIRIDPFLEYDWTVNFYTKEPYKYWKNVENLEEYIEMIKDNTDKDYEELKDKERYVCHHHPNDYNLDKYVDKLLDEYKSKIKGDKKEFEKIEIDDKSHLKISSLYINKI